MLFFFFHHFSEDDLKFPAKIARKTPNTWRHKGFIIHPCQLKTQILESQTFLMIFQDFYIACTHFAHMFYCVFSFTPFSHIFPLAFTVLSGFCPISLRSQICISQIIFGFTNFLTLFFTNYSWLYTFFTDYFSFYSLLTLFLQIIFGLTLFLHFFHTFFTDYFRLTLFFYTFFTLFLQIIFGFTLFSHFFYRLFLALHFFLHFFHTFWLFTFITLF